MVFPIREPMGDPTIGTLIPGEPAPTMTTLENDPTGPDFEPRFQFERSRWATFRDQNVNSVRELWTGRPDLVQVLEDPRLGTAQLVMLRKDRFEPLVAVLEDLASGRSALCFEVEQLTRISTALRSIVQREPKDEVALLVDTVLGSAQRLKTHIVPAGAVSRLAPAELSADDKEFLRQQEKLDAQDS